MSVAASAVHTEPVSRAAPPALLGVLPDGVPAALKAQPSRWAPWQASWKPTKRKYDKVPCEPGSLHHTSTKGTWWSFDTALASYTRGAARGKSAGVGFNMTGVHGLVGIDLDKCVVDGALAPWAREVVDRIGSYAELSPSGNGVRIFVAGTIAEDWTNHPQGVEVYGGHAARFLTLTGRRIEGTPADVQPLPEGAIDWLETAYKRNRDHELAQLPADMPELLAEETLPNYDELNLSAAARAFLEGESSPDRSHALALTTRSLYEATATGDGQLRDDVVLSMLMNNPHAWDVATSHRPRSDEVSAHAAALDYLWKHHCLKLRAKVSPAVLGFEVIDTGGEEFAAGDRAEEKHGAAASEDVASAGQDAAPAARTSAEDPTSASSARQTPPASPRPQPIGLEFVDFATLAHSRPPERRWTVDKWLATGTVTALFGPPGVGKSLLAEQLAVAVANGDPWLGLQTTRGPVIGLFCEDDDLELKWRALHIFRAGNYEAAKASGGLHLDARAGKTNALVEFGQDRVGRPTLLMRKLQEQCSSIRPALVILDNVAQMFTGVENDRGQVTAFCNQLTGLARAHDCAVLLLGHPAKAPESEYSGSTAWDAAVRARLFLERQKEKDGILILSKSKANYAGLGQITLEYQPPGMFARLGDGASADPAALEEAKTSILDAVRVYTGRQQATSHVPTARNYVLKVMERDRRLEGITDRVAATALAALLDVGQLVPNSDLAWKTPSRHKAQGLAAPGWGDA